MVGTLVLGALAYRAYGPQLEKLAPFVDRAKQLATETFSSEDEVQPPAADTAMAPLTPAPPEAFQADAQPLHAPPLVDSQVHPVGGQQLQPVAPGPIEADRSPVALVFDELKNRGISRCSLDPWGDNGEFFRFHCEAPVAGGSGFTRHFEAVSANPAEAAQEVLRQVSEWQLASGTGPLRR